MTNADQPDSSVTIGGMPNRLTQDHAIHIWIRKTNSLPWTKLPLGSYTPGDLQLGTGRGDRQNRDDTFTFTMMLGDCRYPGSSEYVHTSPAEDLDGYWVKVAWKIPESERTWATELSAGEQIIKDGDIWWYCPFVGQIRSDTRKVSGNSVDQTFTAYGGLQYLAGCAVSGFFHEDTPDMLWWNMRPTPWNRSVEMVGVSGPDDGAKSYRFGTGKPWSIGNFAVYLIDHFVNMDPYLKNREGKIWFGLIFPTRMHGFLESSPTSVVPEASDTALSLLRRLFQADSGIDFYVSPRFTVPEEGQPKDFAGYNIKLFSLITQTGGRIWDESAAPDNKDVLIIDKRNNHSVYDIQKTKSNIRRYYKYRIIGEKIRVIGTFSLADAPNAAKSLLVKGWSDELEEKYANGVRAEGDAPGETSREEVLSAGETAKLLRAEPQFEDVFTKFIADKPTFNPERHKMNPAFDENGGYIGQSSTFQLQSINMLKEMIVGFDPEKSEWIKMPPSAWHIDYPHAFGTISTKNTNVVDIGMTVKPLEGVLGISLKASPRHHIAKGGAHAIKYTTQLPEYSYLNLIATVAWETDMRISNSYIDASVSPDAGELCIYAPGYECWYISPGTFLGKTGDDNVAIFQLEPKVVRNDAPQMRHIFRSIIAKHVYQARCEVGLAGLWPVAHFIGRMATSAINTMNGVDTVETINSVVTSVRFSLGKSRSVHLEMGYANRQGPRKAKRLRK